MGGFKTLTVRSTDKPRVKVKVMQKFSDPRSDARGFIADINIINTRVNLHYTYCNLKVKNLFYNHKEYILLTK